MKTWNDITVKQWQIITDAVERHDHELLLWIELLPILEPITPEQVRELKTSDFNNMVRPWKQAMAQENDSTLRKEWKHNGRTFVCNHDLRELTIEKQQGLTTIQGKHFIDSSELSKIGTATETYHIFLAIWWEEKGKGYDAANLLERAEYIKNNMPMAVAYPVSKHFFQLWIDCLPAIQTYLKGKEVAVGLAMHGTGTAS